ncbi:MAG: diaminopimelate decarboxylase, partial [Planctomycetota bacterium]
MDPKLAQLDSELLERLAAQFGTPLYVTNMDLVLERMEHLREFDTIRYAQKAYSNLSFLRALRTTGCALDVVSAGEIERGLRSGFLPDHMVYTSDLFDEESAARIGEHDIHVCAGSRFMLDQLAELPGRANRQVTLRINPGFGDGHDFKVITGGTRSKHGIWHEELEETIDQARSLGLEVTGLHAHIGSGAGNDGFDRLREALPDLARRVGPPLRTLSVGGGLPVPYRDEEPEFDAPAHGRAWRRATESLRKTLGDSLQLEVEPGRYLTAPAAVLLARVHGV